VLLCDLEDGRRALVTSDELAEVMTREEFCGRTLRLSGARVAALG
jgi:hypothetical protein